MTVPSTTSAPCTTVLVADQVVLGAADLEAKSAAKDGLPAYDLCRAALYLEDQQIVQVERLSPGAPPSLAQGSSAPNVIDFGERLITPAFVNAHTHLAMSAFRGLVSAEATRGRLVEDLFFRLERALEPGDVRAFTRLGAYESVLHGVGLVWDHYYAGWEVAEALRDVGLPGVVAPTLQDLDGPGCERVESQLAATEKLATDATMRAAGIFAAVGLHATDTVSDDLLKRAVHLAQQQYLPVHMHLAQSAEEHAKMQARHGCSPLAWLSRSGLLDEAPAAMLAHALFVNADDWALLRPAVHQVAACPHAQMIFAFVAPLAAWARAGVPWVLGTDCAASNDSLSMQKELRAAAGQPTSSVAYDASYAGFLGGTHTAQAVWERRQAVLDVEPLNDAAWLLERAWRVPGGLHPGFEAGALRAGVLANLIVWDTNHPSLWPATDPLRVLAYGDTSQAIHAAWLAGRLVGEVGSFHTSVTSSVAYRDAVQEAKKRLTALRGRLG